MAGLIGKKIGMTRIFSEEGIAYPVTVVEAGPCPVLQIKTAESDGYEAVQLGFGAKKAKRSPKAELGHAAKAGVEVAPVILREFALGKGEEYEPGQELTVELFEAGDSVVVTGTSKGKGFQGGVKRHGFAGRPASHPERTPPGSSREKSSPVRWGTSGRPSGIFR